MLNKEFIDTFVNVCKPHDDYELHTILCSKGVEEYKKALAENARYEAKTRKECANYNKSIAAEEATLDRLFTEDRKLASECYALLDREQKLLDENESRLEIMRRCQRIMERL